MNTFRFATLALLVSVCALTQICDAAQMALKIDKTEDGSNYFEVPQHSSLDKDIGSTLTVEAWVNPSENNDPCNNSYQILNKENSYEIAIRTTEGKFMVAIWPMDVDSGTWDWNDSEAVIPVNTWTHVAATWDGLIARTFVNGKFLKSFDQWTGPGGAKGVLNLPDPPEPLRVGRRGAGGDCHQPFAGLIDEVRISKVVRYTEAGFALPTKEFEPDADTVALYHFNEADVNGVVKDASKFGNNGKLFGKAVLVAVTDGPFKAP